MYAVDSSDFEFFVDSEFQSYSFLKLRFKLNKNLQVYISWVFQEYLTLLYLQDSNYVLESLTVCKNTADSL